MKNIFFSFISMFLVSCHSPENISDKKIFRYNEHSGISSLDPAFARTQSNIWAVHQLFNGLVQMDDTLHVRPDIAKHWDISDDGLTYTFSLRDDVYFHKHPAFGTPDSTRTVTAEDFRYSFARLQDASIAAPGNWILQNVARYTALNDTVFQIHLKKNFPPFLGLMTTKYASVVPREVVEYQGNDFRKNPIGTGAFLFRVWDENNKLILRRNPKYHESDHQGNPLPYLDGIAISFLPEKQSEFMALLQRKIDMVNSIDASYKDELLTAEGVLNPKYSKQFTMTKSPYLNTEYLGIVFDKSNAPLQQPALRKAIQIGFDRQKMIRYLRNNIGIPAYGGFIPQGLDGHLSETLYRYDPEQAKQIVSEYTLQHQKAPGIRIATDANYLDICEYIQRELQKIGFDCAIDLMPSSALRQSRATLKLPLFRASWIADYPDAENYLSLFYSKNFVPEGSNYTHFSNPQFDRWYEQSLQTTDLGQRTALYQRMDSLLMQHLPVIPVYYDQTVRFYTKEIENLTPNPINLLNLKSVKKK
ncbi:MAG: ABC transporter substrate-binding protein [Capnocytophaga sp.]|nr:ABC transporter substrate-binding protein [Capnocytophaga sp.]